MNLFEHFNTVNFVLISMACYCITFFCRTLVEYHLPNWTANPYYRKVALPLSPVIFGIGIGVSFGPLLMDATMRGYYAFVICYGAVAGLVSGFIFRSVKGLIQAKKETGDNDG